MSRLGAMASIVGVLPVVGAYATGGVLGMWDIDSSVFDKSA